MSKKLFRKGLLLCVILCLISFIWYCKHSKIESEYYNPKVIATHYNGEKFVGSTTCIECHADIYNTHIQTAHFNTSAKASEKVIKGSFEEGENSLSIQDAQISMIKNGASFYEEKDFKFGNKPKSISKLDIVIGSGVKGQSFLNWKEDKLYQIQTSFYTPTKSWINSPNFSNLSTQRPISDACIKCHVTFAKNVDPAGLSNQYVKESIIYGINCERCHQPAANHVTYHRENPEATESKFILVSGKLSREQSLDACAQCHSGLRARQIKGNPFSFIVGERLEDYSKNYATTRSTEKLDVHGNQYGLLTRSKCFKESEVLDCTSCHNPHTNQRGDTTFFNQKCISCHNTAATTCSTTNTFNNPIENNCIGCHMPLTPSKSMKVQTSEHEEAIPVYIRTHLIGIYPETPISE